MTSAEIGLLRTIAFHMAQEYPPSFFEWTSQAEVPSGTSMSSVEEAAKRLIEEGRVIESRGRVVLPGRESLIEEHESRRGLFPAKIRKAKRVAAWLARQGGVRFVALCNTTALAHARANSDLDFFTIVKQGSIWQTRLLSALPYKLTRRRPGEENASEDAICLSFFLDDQFLSLEPLQIQKDGRVLDPYLRYWFLSLLPLYDDGIGECLWKENNWVTNRHGIAERWIAHPDVALRTPRLRIPSIRALESTAKRTQQKSFPLAIKEAANRGTNVMISDRMLKFHTTDRREQFRDIYERLCRASHIEP